MRRGAALAFAGILLAPARGSGDEPPAAGPAPAPAPPAAHAVAGTYVEASGDVSSDELRAAVLLGDQLVPLLARHFEAEIPVSARPLRVVIHASQEAFREAAREDGAAEGDIQHASGFTPHRTLVSRLWPQPEAFDPRRVLLRELTHQTRIKTFAEHGPDTDVDWHREGLAEHFGWHLRTKNELRVGAIDAIARNELPLVAGRRVSERTFLEWELATGELPADPSDALCLVEALLRTSDAVVRDAFRAWQRQAWRTPDAGARFRAAFEPLRARLAAAVREVWDAHPFPWQVWGGSWDQDDDGVVARSHERAPATLGAGWKGGVVPEVKDFGTKGGGPGSSAGARLLAGGTGTAGVQLLLVPAGYVQLARTPSGIVLSLRNPKKRVDVATWPLPPDGAAVELSLTAERERIRATAAWGEVVHRRDLPSEAEERRGVRPLALEGCIHPVLILEGVGVQRFDRVVLLRR